MSTETDPTPARSGGTDPESVVRAFFDRMAEGGHVVDALDEFMTPECVWENSGLPTAPDREAAKAMMGQFVEGFSMHRLVVDVVALAVSGDLVLTERIDHMDDEDGNRLLSFPLAGVLRVVHGRIVRWSDYFDPRPLLPPA